MAKRDYYDILGVGKDANEDDIRKAYRTLAKKYHPDVSKEDNAEEKFKEVQNAYEHLSDADKRAAYDRFGHDAENFGGFGQGFSGFSGFGDFGGFEDIFSDFFGGGSRQRQRSNRNVRWDGGDVHKHLTVDFLDAALGTKLRVSIEREVDCSTCNGTGAKSKSDIETCRTCRGSGSINVDQRTPFGTIRTQTACTTCGGSGETIKNKCETCNGQGRVISKTTETINVPAGVNNDDILRVPNLGQGGHLGGRDGDLLITFRVRAHKEFKRDGNNILLKVPISLTEAVLGAKIEVPTIYGEEKIDVPSGTQCGDTFKIRNMGTLNPRNNRKGDQILTFKVNIPKKLTQEERKLFEQLAKIETPEKESGWQKFKNIFKKE